MLAAVVAIVLAGAASLAARVSLADPSHHQGARGQPVEGVAEPRPRSGMGQRAGPCPPEPGNRSAAPIRLVPDRLELPAAAPGSTVTASVWIVNTGGEPVRMTAARGSCGCTAVDFQPGTLAAGASREVALRVKAPARPGQERDVTVTFLAEGHPAVQLPVRARASADDASAAACSSARVASADRPGAQSPPS